MIRLMFVLALSMAAVARGEGTKKIESTTVAKTPSILSLRGTPMVETGRDTAPKPGHVGLRLVERAVLKTGPSDELRLQLDPKRTLRLNPSSKLTLPGISWEDGQVPQIVLAEGAIRLTSGEAGVRVQTPIFDIVPPAGDFIFSYDAKTARAEVWVIAGEVDFGATNAEDSIKVTAGKKAWFQGVVEDGEVAADLLLHGRKIPRGKLSAAVPLTSDEIKPYLEEEKIRQVETKAKEEKIRRQKDTDRKEGVICASPRGRLNECAWVCAGNPKDSATCRLGSPGVKCVRQRCNANGVWAEPKTLDADAGRARCRATAVVGPCDY